MCYKIFRVKFYSFFIDISIVLNEEKFSTTLGNFTSAYIHIVKSEMKLNILRLYRYTSHVISTSNLLQV